MKGIHDNTKQLRECTLQSSKNIRASMYESNSSMQGESHIHTEMLETYQLIRRIH